MAAVPVGVWMAMASTAMSAMAQRGMEKRQEKLANAMTSYQRTKADEGRAAAQKFIDTTQPEMQAQERTDIANELRGSLNDSVGAVRKFEAPQNIAGKVSDDYLARRDTNEQVMGERLQRAIDQLSIIGTPAHQGMRSARRFSQAAGDVDASNIASRNVSGAYTRGIDSQRPSSFLSFASELAKGVGMASAMGAFNGSTEVLGDGLKIPEGPAQGLKVGGGVGLKPSKKFPTGSDYELF